jgi:ferredoxin
MPADTLEILEGDEEGIERLNGWGPVEIRRDGGGAVAGVLFRRCARVYDENRRFSPVFDDSIRHNIPCDTVLLAVGQVPSLDFLQGDGSEVEMARPGWPKVDSESLRTTAAGVFVAGDLAHGTRLLIDAVASGKKAARSVYQYLTGSELRYEAMTAYLTLPQYRRERGYETIRRQMPPVLHREERLQRPDALVEIGYDRQQAMREASRCLDCGVTPVFDSSRCVLCGGCADVCPTRCLKLVSLKDLEPTEGLSAAIEGLLGPDAELEENSAILKDEDRCIRCALCAARCPADAITMERVLISVGWRSL